MVTHQFDPIRTSTLAASGGALVLISVAEGSTR